MIELTIKTDEYASFDVRSRIETSLSIFGFKGEFVENVYTGRMPDKSERMLNLHIDENCIKAQLSGDWVYVEDVGIIRTDEPHTDWGEFVSAYELSKR